MRYFPVIVLLIAGCGLNSDNYPDKYAKTLCDAYIDCEVNRFEEAYDDRKDCENAISDSVWRLLGGVTNEECPFDKGAAQTCLQDLKNATCDSLAAGTWNSPACAVAVAGCTSED
ncbi:MAG: hypothetical protein ACI9MC_000109 [Kiritimatiellia bacterium]